MSNNHKENRCKYCLNKKVESKIKSSVTKNGTLTFFGRDVQADEGRNPRNILYIFIVNTTKSLFFGTLYNSNSSICQKKNTF